jgi:excisionase family DNA binding protein
MTDPILTLPEVANLLKVAEKTVYTMAQTGQIPAFKVACPDRVVRFQS